MSQAVFSPCDYVMRVTDTQPKPLTKDMFLSLIGGMDTKFNTEKVREHSSTSEAWKRNLPAVTWQSRFGGEARRDVNASATGLYCLDIDIHHEQKFKDICAFEGVPAAYKWAEEEAVRRAKLWTEMAKREEIEEPQKDALGIVGIHISPSGTGLHVIALCSGSCHTIAEDQKRLASLLDTEYDEVCKDAARIFFIAPKEDWYYLDLETLFQYEED